MGLWSGGRKHFCVHSSCWQIRYPADCWPGLAPSSWRLISALSIWPPPTQQQRFSLKLQISLSSSATRQRRCSAFKTSMWLDSVQFISVVQLCPTLCDPMDCSTPGFPVHHQLPEFTQIHVHRVGDAIQPSHLLSSPSLPAYNLS